jgi:hypothetical protein
MIRALRLLLGLSRSVPAPHEEEVMIAGPHAGIPATLLRPAAAARRRPAWIVLQGLTVYGRRHPSLLRFARALCSSGTVVIVPEIREWTELRMRSAAVIQAAAAAADHLAGSRSVDRERIGLIGFSFGATQGLVAAAAADNAVEIRTVIGFGGYCELHRFAHFMMTGEHEWRGTRYRLNPDPYARWIVAANYLTRVPGHEHLEAVRLGVRGLAEEAGFGGLYKPESYVDPLKEELRRGFNREERQIWDLLAPPAGQAPADVGAAAALGARLADAGLAVEPLLDPRSVFARLRSRLVLAHGSGDRLIPFTETLRLREALPPRVEATATVTGLYEHSLATAGLHPFRYAAEVWRLLRLLQTALQ